MCRAVHRPCALDVNEPLERGSGLLNTTPIHGGVELAVTL